MSSKAAVWIIAAGVVVMLLGLTCVPGGVGANGDPTTLAAGASLFSFGALLTAAGMYVKARALQALIPAEAAPEPARKTRGCDLCNGEAPAIQCKVHQLHLCPTCLAEHYDPRSCRYLPPNRRPAGKGGKRLVRASGA